MSIFRAHMILRYNQIYTCRFCGKKVAGETRTVEMKGTELDLSTFLDDIAHLPLSVAHMPVGFGHTDKGFYCFDCSGAGL